MLNRFRDFVKRLELPQETGEDLVYRIVDDNFNTVEVTAAQYSLWRIQNDVTQRAIVGQDTVEDVTIRTTFSIMPEHRSYRPFGTSAYALPMYDPLLEYSQRYDTWREAESGHRDTLERIRRKAAETQADKEIAQYFTGTAAEVREAISEHLLNLFSVAPGPDNSALVRTPMLRADGTSVEVAVTADDGEFSLTEIGDVEQYAGTVMPASFLESLQVVLEDGTLSCKVGDSRQISRAVVALAQAIAARSHISRTTA